MAVSDEVRRERVAKGSRRKRDLAAVGASPEMDYRTFLETHFPDVNHYIASWAYHRCKMRKRTQPTVEEVRAEIEELEARR